MVRLRSVGLSMSITAVVAATCVSAGAASGAPCRVRNVTQDTSGGSLAAMVEKAVDGDRFRVRGTCTGRVVIRDDIVIAGVGERPALTGLGRSQVVFVVPRASATLRGLIIRDGDGGVFGGGGGIANLGRLSLVATRIRQNRSGRGGGISNAGSMRIADSVVRANLTSFEWMGEGGAIDNHGELLIVRSRVNGNVGLTGGGIYNRSGGSVTLISSSVSGNETRGDGAGIANEGTMTLEATNVRANRSHAGAGGGIANSGSVALQASSVTANRSEGPGGGIANDGPGDQVTLDEASTVKENTPDDCFGTTSCSG